ncbi:ANL_collapsed_G0018450.mRNA.1.CDS.1 [Saccharomyces cerevisiae]|nr:ANL_HP_G0047700.mRNA.1.CDS.1 [Saccharomyces cerevisiae]CAI4997836.1 ANL_HP_G0051880.mRNA.1.CDS.1 [Saccharomyces cerevisiae]CAI5011643.1 ANM_HP_G0172560.mRNA.1.CDS.1 [Saccharomyces cerevisiae]CAI5064146.1 ANM_HP_G0203540.mRNA.1.CDS.1 [Saccharomyces cerevisiae]CAI5153629.1 ANL_HP_G0123200.mRNA.1.CDS.1 [Saccharomyces cerevisiae]
MGAGTLLNGLEKENFPNNIHSDLPAYPNMDSQEDGNTSEESKRNSPVKQKSPKDEEKSSKMGTASNIFHENKDIHERSEHTDDFNDGLKLAPDSSPSLKECQFKNWESFWCNTEGYKTKHMQPFHFTSGLEEIKEPVMDLNISTSPYKGQRPNSAPTEYSAATTAFTKTQLEVSFLKTNLLTYIKKEIDICLSSVPFFDDAVQMQKKFLEYRDIDLDEEYELKILGELLNDLNFFHMQENSLLNRELAVRRFSNQPESQNLPSIRDFRNPLLPINNRPSPPLGLKRNGKSFEETYDFTSNTSNFWGEKAELQNSITGGTPYFFHPNNIHQTKPFMSFENQNELLFQRKNSDYKQHFNSGRNIHNGVESKSYRGVGLNDSYQKGYAAMTKSFGNIDLNRMPRRSNEEMYSWSRN